MKETVKIYMQKSKKALEKLGADIMSFIQNPNTMTVLCMCAAFAIFVAEMAQMFCMFPHYYSEPEYPACLLESED